MTYPDRNDLAEAQAAINKLPYELHAEAWEDIRQRGAGDCKDSVLGGLHALLERGWPIESLKIGICRVEPENRLPGQTHAVLVVNDKHVLDERQEAVVTIDELDHLGYEPIEIQREGGSRTFVGWSWT